MFTLHAQAQLRGLLSGDQWLLMNSDDTEYLVSELPTHPIDDINDELEYHGQSAKHSQFVQLDPGGNLLFFIVDGSVYDNNGFLIGDVSCDPCLYLGRTQVIAAPIPGQCNMYYLLSVIPEQSAFDLPDFQVIVLDMNVQNPNLPAACGAGKGAFGPHALVFNENSAYGFLHPMVDIEPPVADLGTDDYSMILPFPTSNVKASRAHLAIYDPGWQDGTLLYHIVTDQFVFQYHLRSDGIFFAWVYSSASGIGGNEMWSHDVAFGTDGVTGDILFAWTNCYGGAAVDDMIPDPGEGNPIPQAVIALLRLDPVDGTIQPGVTGYNPTSLTSCGDGGNDKVLGCAFDPTGTFLYFTAVDLASGIHIGQLELATGDVVDVAYELNIADPEDYALTHIERSTTPDGSSEVLLFAYEGGIAMLVGPEDLGTATWVTQLPVSDPINTVPRATAVPAYLPPWLLNAGIMGQAHVAAQAAPECCPTWAVTKAWDGNYQWEVQNTWATRWQAGDNPLDNATEVIFCEDFVLESGSNLFVSDMTWRFVEDARLIVEDGAMLHLTDVTLTSVCDMPWPGVRVQGVTSNHTQAMSVQGRLYMSDCLVENATAGVWCAKELGNGQPDPDGYGGWVSANQSTFHNCRQGVVVSNYKRYNSLQTAELPHRAIMNGCTFSYDEENPHALPLLAHVQLTGTNGVKVLGCDLRNDSPEAYPFTLRGVGIAAWWASFQCHGGSEYEDHGFRNLTAGVFAFAPDPANRYTVDGMAFHNNYTGVLDWQSINARITNNEFITMDHSEPTPNITSHGLNVAIKC
jgi:hypothetical protein